jgi:putative ABC transport system permease protein
MKSKISGFFLILAAVFQLNLVVFSQSQDKQVVYIWEANSQFGKKKSPVAVASFLYWRDRSQVFSGIAAYTELKLNLRFAKQTEPIKALAVSEGFFSVTGTSPLMGRIFVADEYETNPPSVLVLSRDLWQKRYGSDPAIIGRQLILGNKGYTVIGITATEAKPVEGAGLFIPLVFTERREASRTRRFLTVIARLKPGVTLEQTQVEMTKLSAQLAVEHPKTNKGWGVIIEPYRRMP